MPDEATLRALPGRAEDTADDSADDSADGEAALEAARAVWTDPARPVPERVAALLSVMTLQEKTAQLVGVWLGTSREGEEVAPAQHELNADLPPWSELIRGGLGQLTRTFGTGPVSPLEGTELLARRQRDLVAGHRLGIPAVAHEECLTGLESWAATIFPIPLAWAATFDPDLVREATGELGATMRSVGIHQGLAPVLDVSRDPRWGRTEETLGEDPYLVGTVGSAYVAGLETAGVVTTLKHFAGHPASRGGRNQAPVSMGRRELADVILPPFEMALRLGGARSVMHSYTDLDGVPSAADAWLLTELLRDGWGFDGTVVADYFGITFLETAHRVAGGPADAAALALTAGVDVELPTLRCYAQPLLDAVGDGRVSVALVDRAVERVLRQKCELGLLDAGWTPEPPALRDAEVDLDPPAQRALVSRLAEESVVLLHNPDGVLPLAAPARVAVVGPAADDVRSLMGCYAFPSHVGSRHDDLPLGLEMPTLLDAVRREWPGAEVSWAPGVTHAGPDRSGLAAAVEAAGRADVVVLAVGDRSGMFGAGTSGEGCDAPDLSLPGLQDELVDAVLDAVLDAVRGTGAPVVLVVLSGRPYALGRFVAGDHRVAAIVQAFFPGQLGAPAVTGVLSGRVNPSGRLPIQIPRNPGGQPNGYLHPPLGGLTRASTLDPTPAFPFGFGLSYSRFTLSDLELGTTDLDVRGTLEVSVTVTNDSDRDGDEVVQVYLDDLVASVTRPVRQLVGFARVPVPAGRRRRVTFELHADRFSFTGLRGRIVEPGDVDVLVGRSSAGGELVGRVRLTGATRAVGPDRVLDTPVRVGPPA